MTETVNFRAEYSGYIQDTKIAWTYKAYAEEDQPYVVALLENPRDPLVLIQIPSDYLNGELDADEAEEVDRQNAIRWVDALTKLVDKARKWDEFVADISGIAECHNGPVPFESVEPDFSDDADLEEDDDPYQVDELDDDCVDQTWEDQDGDKYRFIDGEWHVFDDAKLEWEPLGNAEWLYKYGPYTVVGK